ncbi:hypothetical protein GCM10009642_20800 [Nocardiopsis metallicus]
MACCEPGTPAAARVEELAAHREALATEPSGFGMAVAPATKTLFLLVKAYNAEFLRVRSRDHGIAFRENGTFPGRGPSGFVLLSVTSVHSAYSRGLWHSW